MNNNLYNWHDERMVELKMKELNQELEQARLINEAGLSGSNRLAHAIEALRRLLNKRSSDFQDHSSVEQQSYQSQGE